MTGLFGISRDITAMVQARRALAEREHRYHLLFEAHPQPLWMFDLATQRFLDVNPAVIARYGYSREEFLAMTLADLRPPEHRPALAQDLAGRRPGEPYGSAVSGPWVHRRRDGSLIEVEVWSNDVEVDGRSKSSARSTAAPALAGRLRARRVAPTRCDWPRTSSAGSRRSWCRPSSRWRRPSGTTSARTGIAGS